MKPVRSAVSVPPVLEPLEPRLLLDGQTQAIEFFNLSPALFVENQGQWSDSSVRYAFQRQGADIAFTDTGPVFHLYSADDSVATFSTNFVGARNVAPVGLNPQVTTFTNRSSIYLTSAAPGV